MSAPASGSTQSPNPPIEGQWAGPYPNTPPLGNNNFTPPLPPPLPPAVENAEYPFDDGPHTGGILIHEEIGHACLIPPQTVPGDAYPHAGKVLVWNRQVFGAINSTPPVIYPVTRKVWIIDPSVTPPAWEEIPIPSADVGTGIFCFGHAWSEGGKLVMAGSDVTVTNATYSFVFDPATLDPLTGVYGKFYAGPVSPKARFYPTLTLTQSGRILMAGGRVPIPLPGYANKWNEIQYFSLAGTTLTAQPDFAPNLAHSGWGLITPLANYAFDYFPRMFSMNDPAGGAVDFTFIANDVIGQPVSPQTGPPTDLKLSSYTFRDSDQRLRIHDGVTGAPPFPIDPAPSADRRYGSTAMMCLVNPGDPTGPLLERLFTICGSDQARIQTPGAPALNTMDEFLDLESGLSTQRFPAGTIQPKQRIWQNATLLPDMSVVITGGSSVDSEFTTQLTGVTTYALPVKEAELFYPVGTPGA
ncbi:MAG: hypothetical protein JNJ88_09535, partial [Planctomycetes bacterium]|nr:hypothetical protein [Planctomycetota bacterium]